MNLNTAFMKNVHSVKKKKSVFIMDGALRIQIDFVKIDRMFFKPMSKISAD